MLKKWLPVLSSLSYIRLCAQRSKASLLVSDCRASSHPLHLLRPDFPNNEKHPILSLRGREKLFLMPRTLCSQLLAKLAPSRPSGLRVNATSPENPFLTPHHPQSSCLSHHTGYFLLCNYQKPQWFGLFVCFVYCSIGLQASEREEPPITYVFSTVVSQHPGCSWSTSVRGSWEGLPHKGVFDQGLGRGTGVYPPGALKMRWHQACFSVGRKCWERRLCCDEQLCPGEDRLQVQTGSTNRNT